MVEEGIRCPQCHEPPCVPVCPIGVDIPGFIKLVREGDSAGALARIREANDLPAICGRICSAPCEKSCVLWENKNPIAVRALERYASDNGRPRFAARKQITPTGKKVSVIGSGPAGLVAASRLARAGFKVTVFEMMPLPGGVLRYGIPEFRLPKNVLEAEIEDIRGLGVEFKTNFFVGQNFKIEQFLSEGYSAVLLTFGKNTTTLSDLPGADLGGVYYAKEVLLNANNRFEENYKKNPLPLLGPKVAVIGEGSAALDCARICLRLGREVTLIIPETDDDLKAYPEDVQLAREEGLVIEALTKPLTILSDGPAGSFAAGVQCQRMDFADADGQGTWELKPVPSSEFVVPAQSVILSGGFKTYAAALVPVSKIKINPNGSVWTDPETCLTSMPHVYAAGDAVLGTSSLVESMASAKKAAQSIIKAVRHE